MLDEDNESRERSELCRVRIVWYVNTSGNSTTPEGNITYVNAALGFGPNEYGNYVYTLDAYKSNEDGGWQQHSVNDLKEDYYLRGAFQSYSQQWARLYDNGNCRIERLSLSEINSVGYITAEYSLSYIYTTEFGIMSTAYQNNNNAKEGSRTFSSAESIYFLLERNSKTTLNKSLGGVYASRKTNHAKTDVLGISGNDV